MSIWTDERAWMMREGKDPALKPHNFSLEEVRACGVGNP